MEAKRRGYIGRAVTKKRERREEERKRERERDESEGKKGKCDM